MSVVENFPFPSSEDAGDPFPAGGKLSGVLHAGRRVRHYRRALSGRVLDRLAEPSLWPPLPPARRAYLAWWRLQGQMLKFARATGLWRR